MHSGCTVPFVIAAGPGVLNEVLRKLRNGTMPVNREPQRELRGFREVAGWVWPDERTTRSGPSTRANTSTVGTNTGVTALQQLRFLVCILLSLRPSGT